MQTILLVGLSGDEKGRVRIFTQEQITFGTSATEDVNLAALFANPSGHTSNGPGNVLVNGQPLIARLNTNGGSAGRFEVTDNRLQVAVRHDGDSEAEPLNLGTFNVLDGDRLDLTGPAGSASFLVQFLPEESPVASLIHSKDIAGAALPATEEVSGPHANLHPMTATLFVKELVRSLWAEVRPDQRKRWLFTLAVFGAFLLTLFGWNIYENYQSSRSRARLVKLEQMVETDHDERERQFQIRTNELEGKLSALKQVQSLAENIGQLYRPGVCLIVGAYGYLDKKTGKSLRYRDANDTGEPLGNDQGFPASVDGAGPVVVEEFTGTGFLVSDGIVLTNRHVIQPWWNDTTAQRVMADGMQPVMNRLVAYFPGIKVPFVLTVKGIAGQSDVAACSFDPAGYVMPILPLADSKTELNIGGPVVLLGYPAGVEGLLERLDDSRREEISHKHSVDQVTHELADMGQIRPLTTQGSLTDIVRGRIVHSAATTEGGSGGPLFNRESKVIGINSAVLFNQATSQEFSGSNFAIPIEPAVELLKSFKTTASK